MVPRLELTVDARFCTDAFLVAIKPICFLADRVCSIKMALWVALYVFVLKHFCTKLYIWSVTDQMLHKIVLLRFEHLVCQQSLKQMS